MKAFLGEGAGPVLLLVGVVVGVGAAVLFYDDGRTVQVRASGAAEWMYQDTHGEANPLDPERFGTPKNPKGLDIIPLTNRAVSRGGSRYTGLKDGQVFSLDRTPVTGSVRFSGTDRVALDSAHGQDAAKAEATFTGPDGAEFRVVLKKLVPPEADIQAFGGVAINQLVHGSTGFGTDELFPEYAYLLLQGFADVYRNDELIVEDNYLWLAASRRAAVTSSADKLADRYNLERPFADMIIHLVLLPTRLLPDGTYAVMPIPTGVIGLDGKEQEFFHINFRENIVIEGHPFDDANQAPASSSHSH